MSEKVIRPWGSYQSTDHGERFQVKRLEVNPASKLSLQKHQHRAEHWVVVEGTATIHLDGKESDFKENEYIYIPQGSVHRIENKTDKSLIIVEVQYGSYLGEDDIIRLEDDYGREGTTDG